MNSQIYKELTKNEIDKIVIDLYGNDSEITECRLLKGGLFNTTYYIATNTDTAGIVLRAAPVKKDLLINFEKNMMSAEPLFHKLLADNDIPTSQILKYSPNGEVIDREYIISRYIPSIPMSDISSDKEDLGYLYEQVGSLIRKMHGIKNDRFGWKRPDRRGEYDTWKEFIFVFAGEANDKALAYNLLDSEYIKRFNDLLNESTNALNEITEPHMSHNDLWEGNILLGKDNGNGKYYVAAIIDIDKAIFGDRYWDMAMQCMMNPSFMKGYADIVPDDLNHKKRQHIYKLIGIILECYIAMIEFDDNEWYEKVKTHCISLLENKYK